MVVSTRWSTGARRRGEGRTALRKGRHLDDPDRVVGAAADEDRRRRVELERRDGEVVRVQDGEERLSTAPGGGGQGRASRVSERGREGGKARARSVTASRMPTLRSDEPYAKSVPSSLCAGGRAYNQHRRPHPKVRRRGRRRERSGTHLTSKAVTGFWLTVLVLSSFHARVSHRLTNAFLLPAGGLRTLPAGDALTTVYRLDAVAARPNLCARTSGPMSSSLSKGRRRRTGKRDVDALCRPERARELLLENGPLDDLQRFGLGLLVGRLGAPHAQLVARRADELRASEGGRAGRRARQRGLVHGPRVGGRRAARRRRTMSLSSLKSAS